MSQGTYEESLPTGGKLSVTRNSWNIDYYFPVNDLVMDWSVEQVRLRWGPARRPPRGFELSRLRIQLRRG